MKKQSFEGIKISQKEMKRFIKNLRVSVKEIYPREFEKFKKKGEAKKRIEEMETLVLSNLREEVVKEKIGSEDIGELTKEKKVWFYYSQNPDGIKQVYLYCLLNTDRKRFNNLLKLTKSGETVISFITKLFPMRTKRGAGNFGSSKRDTVY